ncbi:MAG: dimethylsulfonioproprionate lyase family protein [Actinomycetota bacterium]|nr:dimethylsulfonioproprionate lyase family protein [Actinomycetota bacterium]
MILEFEVAGEIMNVLQDHDKIRTWLISAADSAISLPSEAIAKEGAWQLRSAIEKAAPIAYEAKQLTALQNLGDVCDTPRAREFTAFASSLRWVESERWNDRGRERALCILSDAFDLPGLEVGIMYVDRGCSYPIHNHPPQEMYLTISGTAQWRYGGSKALVEVKPESVLYNHPFDLHTVQAGDTPLVALYVLWGFEVARA